VLLLFASSVWAVSCATDSPSPTSSVERFSGPAAHLPIDCNEYPNDPECQDPPPNPPGGGTLPPCSQLSTHWIGSATGVTDTTVAVSINGPYSVSSCSGPSTWQSSVSGASGTPYYYWYVAQCTGGINFCDADTNYVLAAEGYGQTSLSIVIPTNVRAQHTFVLVCEQYAPNCRSGVSLMMYTRGPAWGAEPTGGASGQCFADRYPLIWDVTKVDTSKTPDDTFNIRRNYTRNYCTGRKKFDSTYADTTGRDP
jgi:hypothetical protein